MALFFSVGASLQATEIVLGSAVTLTVTANGTQPFSYQWRKDGINLSGATAATLRIGGAQITDAGDYSAVVSNGAGSTTSNTATLTVIPAPPPPITIPTANQIATTGHGVSFTATGAANGGQWQVSTDNGSTWTNLTAGNMYGGVNTTTLEITGLTTALNGNRYRYATAGVTSNAVVLTVSPAYFQFPVGIAADRAGNFYVSDSATDTIRKISANGMIALLAGSPGQIGTTDGPGASARLNSPVGIAAAADGTVSVADSANGTIRQITPAGKVSTLAGSTTSRGNTDGTGTAATFSSPLGVAVTAGGVLYVADALNNTIRKIAAGGAVSTLAGTAGSTGSTDGTGPAARFNHPTGMAVDGAGNVYVADATNNTIRKITPAGAVSTLAGLPGVSGSVDGTGSAALFNNPGGLAVDGSGNLYVADTGNSTIRRITPGGAVVTLAGLPGIAGLMDGTGSAAWFNQPQGLVLDATGNLFVADTGNAAIRKVTPAGVVATVALSGASSISDSTAAFPAAPGNTPTPNPAPTSAGMPAAPAPAGTGGGSLNAWLAGALGLTSLLRWIVRRR